MQAQSVPYQRQRQARGTIAANLARLAALILTIVSLASLLAWLSGPPRLPTTMPNAGRIHQLLTGSDLPAADIAYLASSLAWTILAYLLLSVVLRALALVVLWWCGTTRAALQLVRLTNLITAPPVRRLTDGAIAAVMMTSACLVPPARVRAAVIATGPALPRTSGSLAFVVAEQAHVVTVEGNIVGSDDPMAPLAQPAITAVPYTVAEGDTLWRIAERFYGDGHRYAEIIAANVGRVMANGERFDDPRLVRPGWVLFVPLPAANVEDGGAELTYRIQPGDSLWQIAARFLGDGKRWPEIWDRNHGRDMGGGRAFLSPSVLVPGWTLHLPAAPIVTIPDARPPDTPPAPLAPTPAVPTPQPTPPSLQEPVARPTIAPTLPPALEAPRPHEDRGGWSPDPRLLIAGAAGLAATATAVALARRVRGSVAGGAAVERRRRHGSGRQPQLQGGPVRGDVARVQVAARLLLAALGEQGFNDIRVLTCRESDEGITLLVLCPPGDAEAVADARFALARRLNCLIDTRVLVDHHVEIALSRLRREVAALVRDDGNDGHRLLFCPVGADGAAVLYLNLAGLGSIRVAGTATEAAGLLQGWLAMLAASVPADTYAVILVPDPRDETPALREIGVPCWPLEGQDIDEPLAAVATELATRLAGDAVEAASPAIIAVMDAGAEVDVGRLETLLRRGREADIHIVVLEQAEIGHPPAPSLVPAEMYEATVCFAGAGNAGEAPPGVLVVTLPVGQPITLHPAIVSEVYGTEIDDSVPVGIGHHAVHPAEAVTDPARGPGPPIVAQESARDDDVAPGRDAPDSDGQHAARRVDAATECAEDEKRRHPQEPDPQLSLQADTLPTDDDSPRDDRVRVFDVRCFGLFEVEMNGVPITNWKVQKARELLAYLIARGGAPVPREEAWEALWPEGDIGQMQRLLSDAAYHLRRTLKEASGGSLEPLTTQGQRYYLRAELFRVDLRRFDAHLERAARLPDAEALMEYERALHLYRGSPFGGEPFEWLGEHRPQYEMRMTKAAHAAARLALDCHDTERATGWYRQILAHDPIDEQAAQGLMRCYASMGDRSGVRKVYKTLQESLRRELDDPDAKPLPDTEVLMRNLIEQ